MTSSGSSNSSAKTPRKSAPKSRNGCLTCKERRVKCDEEKPKCSTCIKSRRQCKWKPPKEALKKTRDLLPQKPCSFVPIRPTQALSFVDEREAYYFRVYQDETSVELAGVLKSSSTWPYIMLQAAHTEPFVLRSLVAIGALNKSIKMSRVAATYPDPIRQTHLELSRHHREFALATYDKAITGMRNIVSSCNDTKASVRKALLSCLLIFTIENFLNSPNTAFLQSQAGFSLFRQLEPPQPHSYEGIASPNSKLVEDELYHEFARLDLRYAMWWGEKKLQRHRTRRMEGSITIKMMPAYFTSLNEARAYHELLMRRTYHLVGETYALIILAKEKERHLMIADTPGELVDPCHIPTILIRDCRAYLEDIERWEASFQPLFQKLMSSKDPMVPVGAALLKAHALDATMALSGAFFTEECDFDRLLPEARKIVSLAKVCMKIAFQSPEVLPVFNFYLGFEQALYDVAVMCREKCLRYEALDLLRSHATFDTTTFSSRRWIRAAYVVSLEEKGRLPNGEIPESSRWRRIWLLEHYDESSRNTTFICARKIAYPLGRSYPAKREFNVGVFRQEESEKMVLEDGERNLQAWPPSLKKPLAIKWEEVHRELLSKLPRL